jgi:hypothetical protein
MVMMSDDQQEVLRRILEELVAEALREGLLRGPAYLAHDLVVGIMQRLAAAGLEIRRR